MELYLSILLRELKPDQFYELLSLLERYGVNVETVEKDCVTGKLADVRFVYYLLKLRESYAEIRFGLSQYAGIARGLARIAKFGEILISEETEKELIERFQLSSLGMLSIEGMKSQILVCRVDGVMGREHLPDLKSTAQSLIPRTRQIESLQQLLTVTRSVLVYGSPGIGKTTFLDQVIAGWSEREIYRATCTSYITNQTLQPVLDITGQLLGITGIANIAEKQKTIEKRLKNLEIADIGTNYLAIIDFLGLGEEESILSKLDLRTRVDIITNSISEVLQKISWQHPIAVVVEDIENMDHSSARFFTQLRDKMAEENVMFVFTACRSQVMIPGLKEFELSEFEKRTLDEYVSAAIGEELSLPSTNIFHVAQHILLWREERQQYFYSQYRGESSLVNFSLPFHDLKTIIKRRVELLDSHQEFLYNIAVFGSDIDPAQFPGDPRELAPRFDFFTRAQFLKAHDGRYMFTSPSLHELIYDLVPDKESRHARLADYFRRLSGFEEYAAFHYLKAKNSRKAIDFLLRSAQIAIKRGAHESGVQYYLAALEICRREKEAADIETLVTINEGLADVYRALGDEEKALKYYKVVLDSYKEILRE